MAVSANTVWNVNTAGSSNNGGGFVTGASGTDYASTNNVQALTGVTSAGAGNVCLHASAAASWVGNIINVVSGTNFTTTAGAARFEITAVTPGVDFTCSTNISGASISTGVGANGVMNIGGAVALYNSATDDTLFENSVAGNKWYFKTGTHNCGAVTISAAGTQASPIIMEGYNSTYGDKPSIASGSQPTIACGANVFTATTSWMSYNITWTGTGTSVFVIATNGKIIDSKITNSSGTANRNALLMNGSGALAQNSEFVSTNGYAIGIGNVNNVLIANNYIHDSAYGIRQLGATTGGFFLLGNIIDTITTTGIDFSAGAMTGVLRIYRNTIYMAATPTGSSAGFSFAASSGGIGFFNNIISGAVTGVSGATITNVDVDYNNYYNNTTNRTNFPTGTNDIALDPGFVNAPSGNFATGVNVQQVGYPGTFPGGLTVSYHDIGAVQSNHTGFFTDPDLTKINSSYSFKYNTIGANNRTGTAAASTASGSHGVGKMRVN